MLKGINPIISPALLKLLAEMGHGDEIVLADAHFPAHTFCETVIACRFRICWKAYFRSSNSTATTTR
jgi:L-fucose mutarotase/ribose pyranase (RbsD/FucU family)